MSLATTRPQRLWTAARYEKHARLTASLAIIMLCMIWGSTFPMTKAVLEGMNASSYLAVRFLIATVAGFILFQKRIRRMSGREWFYGLSLGGIYAAGQLTQTLGLLYIDASVSGFITVMYVVFTPIFVWLLFRVRVGLADWIAVFLALCGLALLSLSGGQLEFGLGEIFSLLGAIFFALHIVMLSRWAPRGDVVGMSVIQMAVMAVTFLSMSLTVGFELPASPIDWLAIVFMALVAGLLAMSVQSWSQTILSATSVALMFSLEPVFASVFAIMFGGESLTMRLVWGGLLILLAMQVSALGPRFMVRARAMVEKETVLPHTSAGLSQAFEDVFTGGLPQALNEGEEIIGSEGFARTMENGPTEGRS
ncbi:DMT family transporter [Actinomycetaceae bacterium TAE3-ERU4]|nr:DMT family transporter [Actinomycetaceae bacterium TAE3-ERU4]